MNIIPSCVNMRGKFINALNYLYWIFIKLSLHINSKIADINGASFSKDHTNRWVDYKGKIIFFINHLL